MKGRALAWIGASLFLLAAAAALSPLFGSVWISPRGMWEALAGRGDPVVATILLRSRLPRVLLAVSAGAGLSVSGAILQSVLRNPLADPFTLGVASGGTLGAALVILLGGAAAPLGAGLLHGASMAGSLLALAGIVAAARRFGAGSGAVVLAGISFNIVVTSAILFLQYLMDLSQGHLIVRWLMGELDVWGAASTGLVAAVVLPCAALALLLGGRLNQLLLGETLAAARGVDVRRVFLAAAACASLMTGAVVAVCGPIAFVGLVVPHLARFAVGHDNRLVIPLSATGGALLLLVCDTIARSVVAPAQVPVGVLTSIVGGSALVFLLVARRPARGAW